MRKKYRVNNDGIIDNVKRTIKICPVCKQFFISKKDCSIMCFNCMKKAVNK